jgi:tetratricopeptide (TPR) repeat protein
MCRPGSMVRPGGRSWMVAALVSAIVVAAAGGASADSKLRVVMMVPFDATALEPEEQWMGEGVAQILALGLAQSASIVQIERARLRAVSRADAWTEPVLAQTARTVRAEAVLFGRLERRGTDVAVVPQLMEIKPSAADVTNLEPVVAPAGDLFDRLSTLPVRYARTLNVTLSDADSGRVEKAARPTRVARAFELFSRGQIAARRGDQEGNEAAVDLLSRAIEVDPSFVVATYSLGVVHSSLGNRWKAAAQFRASTQLDATYPEPAKALGDLYLSQPRRLFDQAVEAYSRAIELRPFYADAYVGLGDAKAAKSDIDGAIAAYQKALVYNPVNPRVHMSLGKIYYGEKGLYYEAVTAYKKAIDLDPHSVDARMGLGEVYEEKGLYKEATEEYRRVIEIDAKHTGAMYNLALVYEKVDPRAAITQWERYIELASPLATEKDWVDVARQHLRKLKNQVKD